MVADAYLLPKLVIGLSTADPGHPPPDDRKPDTAGSLAPARMREDGTVRHEHHVFQNPPPSTPTEVDAALDRGDLSAALDAMVGTALYGDGDWKDLQELHLRLLDHEDHQVSALAATCLGHLARVYRQLDERRVVTALRRARALPHVRATADNALDDILIFLHPRRARWRGRAWRAIRPWTWI
ncbi:hypothetical protein AB0B57_04150 [Micromonospora sp. NPDC049101]|uniref:hypothetical protein n=1 Tax=unclassified Micromonospora TaxID=2617518 RepID=UPI0033E0B09C